MASHAAGPAVGFAGCLSPATPIRPRAVGELHFPVTPTTAPTPAPAPAAAPAAAPMTVPRRRASKSTKRRGRPRATTTKDGRPARWNTGKWSEAEDCALREGVRVVGPRQWKRISVEFLHNLRSDVQCLHRWQKVLRPGLVKGAWEKDEDETIVRCIKNGIVKWSEIAAHIPGRLGKQCRERWFNHLDPSIKKGGWTAEEDRILEQAQATLGNRWCKIAEMLPGRTENAVKNRWHSAKRRQAHAKRMANAAAARKSGQPLPAAPKLKLPATRRKSKSHVPTPAAAVEAARRCGLNINSDVAMPRATFAASTKRQRRTKGSTRARGRRGRRTTSPHVSPTRPGPAPRPFVFPSHTFARAAGVEAEVVTPHGGADFGLMQLISAIDCDGADGSPSAAHAVVEPDAHKPHVGNRGAHSGSDTDESEAVEALQAMHSACVPPAVGRCTPSPPLKLALNKPVKVADNHLCYTLLPPTEATPTGAQPPVYTYILKVAPADDDDDDDDTTQSVATKRSRDGDRHIAHPAAKRPRIC